MSRWRRHIVDAAALQVSKFEKALDVPSGVPFVDRAVVGRVGEWIEVGTEMQEVG